ncbi:hypothetical protein PR048_032910 [Dryococelus australis]|uniref:Uncharacterized protein n=1 Tax=Dryococelus australis TaxID=614101 RepID=A0ABQ9G4B1_9NEOP|nr:hypothetical protein PR048_032910 [Dryococelus australis]
MKDHILNYVPWPSNEDDRERERLGESLRARGVPQLRPARPVAAGVSMKHNPVPPPSYTQGGETPAPPSQEGQTEIVSLHNKIEYPPDSSLVFHSLLWTGIDVACSMSAARSGQILIDACISSIVLQILEGATVAEQLARSPPTKANRAQSPAGSPDFRQWESCRTMPLVGGFSRGTPVSPALSFRRRSIFSLITLIGSQGFC